MCVTGSRWVCGGVLVMSSLVVQGLRQGHGVCLSKVRIWRLGGSRPGQGLFTEHLIRAQCCRARAHSIRATVGHASQCVWEEQIKNMCKAPRTAPAGGSAPLTVLRCIAERNPTHSPPPSSPGRSAGSSRHTCHLTLLQVAAPGRPRANPGSFLQGLRAMATLSHRLLTTVPSNRTSTLNN